ncbi:hypothetical protein VIGAN_02153300, partial [Vigna angularis var. angularis]
TQTYNQKNPNRKSPRPCTAITVFVSFISTIAHTYTAKPNIVFPNSLANPAQSSHHHRNTVTTKPPPSYPDRKFPAKSIHQAFLIYTMSLIHLYHL